MILKRVVLHQFRNVLQQTVDFSPHLTVVLGPNSRGKTNLLESIFVITNGTGFRETKESELLHFEHTQGSIDALFQQNDDQIHAKVMLVVRGEAMTKTYFINKAKRGVRDYLRDQTRSVLFAPQQIEILTGAPDLRRQYFNRLISVYDFEYKKRLDNYENALRRRNKLLETIHDMFKLKEEIAFWDNYLVEQAEYLTKVRQDYIDFLNSSPELAGKMFSISYEKSEMTRARLDETFDREMRARRTLIGPQKDDFIISLNSKNVHKFGSRSEQRLAILWLKMAEIRHSRDKSGHVPILLLDDIFSEFDEVNKKLVLDLVKDYQTIATTTEKEILDYLPEVEKTVVAV
ncbi:DNA replication and repair protein RecF [Candidatus Microgenomates bacterium]|nr:DNA replication and repair protein RecF [Candidatus Microgenomates bacterium]